MVNLDWPKGTYQSDYLNKNWDKSFIYSQYRGLCNHTSSLPYNYTVRQLRWKSFQIQPLIQHGQRATWRRFLRAIRILCISANLGNRSSRGCWQWWVWYGRIAKTQWFGFISVRDTHPWFLALQENYSTTKTSCLLWELTAHVFQSLGTGIIESGPPGCQPGYRSNMQTWFALLTAPWLGMTILFGRLNTRDRGLQLSYPTWKRLFTPSTMLTIRMIGGLTNLGMIARLT